MLKKLRKNLKSLILRLIEKIVKLARDAFQSVQTTVLLLRMANHHLRKTTFAETVRYVLQLVQMSV